MANKKTQKKRERERLKKLGGIQNGSKSIGGRPSSVPASDEATGDIRDLQRILSAPIDSEDEIPSDRLSTGSNGR